MLVGYFNNAQRVLVVETAYLSILAYLALGIGVFISKSIGTKLGGFLFILK